MVLSAIALLNGFTSRTVSSPRCHTRQSGYSWVKNPFNLTYSFASAIHEDFGDFTVHDIL